MKNTKSPAKMRNNALECILFGCDIKIKKINELLSEAQNNFNTAKTKEDQIYYSAVISTAEKILSIINNGSYGTESAVPPNRE